jgi:hypothetical protein
MKEKKPFFKRFKKTIVALLIFGVMLLLFANWLGFKHIPNHVAVLWSGVKEFKFNRQPDTNRYAPVYEAEVTEVASAPMVPFDTVFWIDQVKKREFIPENVKEDLEVARKMDFSKLSIAKDAPSDEDIQQALIHRYGQKMTQLLENNDAHLKVGKCYQADLQPSNKYKEQARVTCMVCAFDSKNRNLGNISMPLYIVYDFVKYEEDPHTWYVTDFSQSIPYDYKLNKH